MSTGSEDKGGTSWADLTAWHFNLRPKLLQDLQQRTVELMAVPQLRCLIGKCRRRRRCCFLREEDRSPWCLCNLDPEERAGYQLLLDKAMRHYVRQAMPPSRRERNSTTPCFTRAGYPARRRPPPCGLARLLARAAGHRPAADWWQ